MWLSTYWLTIPKVKLISSSEIYSECMYMYMYSVHNFISERRWWRPRLHYIQSSPSPHNGLELVSIKSTLSWLWVPGIVGLYICMHNSYPMYAIHTYTHINMLCLFTKIYRWARAYRDKYHCAVNTMASKHSQQKKSHTVITTYSIA